MNWTNACHVWISRTAQRYTRLVVSPYFRSWSCKPSQLLLGETVRVGFCLWVVNFTRVAREGPRFGAGIAWGTIPSGFPVFPVSVSGCSWNSHGTSPSLWVQKKLVKFRQGTQSTWLCSAKFFWEFFCYSALNLLGNLGDVILNQISVKRVLSSTVSSAFRCFSQNCC